MPSLGCIRSTWTCKLQLFLILGTKLGILGHQLLAQIWKKIRSKRHARENAGATLHPNKEKGFMVMRFWLYMIAVIYHVNSVFQ